MTPLATLVWILNLVCVTAGHLALKGVAVDGEDEEQWLARWVRMLKSPLVWFGVAAFIGEFVLWLAFLSLVPLSLAVLMGSIDTLAVLIGGRIFFGERLTPGRTLSTMVIATGVALVGWG